MVKNVGDDEKLKPREDIAAKLDPLGIDHTGARGLGSGVSEWCVLPMTDKRRQTWGVVRGASQVPLSPRRPMNELPTTHRKETRGDTSAKNIGFRCSVALTR